MATSPIYSWPEPDNTDLVKNGALAMRTLGNAIDTTMATMTPKSVVDAKGDLIAATANDTPARLAVGNNGEVLIADSTTSTGLRYQATQAAGKNALINGGLDIWQRGTSFSTAGKVYTCDRWEIWSTGAGGTSILNRVAGTNGAQYAAEFGRPSGSTTLTAPRFAQTIETANSIQYAGKTIVVSFEALKGANYSGGDFTCTIITGTGTDQNFTAFSGSASAATTFTLTTTNTRYSASYAIPAGTTEIAVEFSYVSTGTAGASDYVRIQKVMMELGSVPTTFTRATGTIQGELAACQRYYFRAQSTGGYKILGSGYAGGTGSLNIAVPLPSQMRVIPTSLETSAMASYYYESGAGGTTPTTVTLSTSATENIGSVVVAKAASFTAGNAYWLFSNNTAAYLGFSAEL